MLIFSNCLAARSQTTIAVYRSDLEKTNSPKTKADICFEISEQYSQILKIDSAFYFANKVQEYSRPINYETGIGKYHLATGMALFYRGKNGEAEANALKAIEIFARLKETRLLGKCYLVLGSNQNVTNNILQARSSYWTAINCFEKINDARGLYSSYRWLGYSYFNGSETDSLSFYQTKSLLVAEQLNEKEKIHQAACWMGSTFLSLKEYEKAIKYFEYGFNNQSSRTDKVGLRSLKIDYATCLILTQKFHRADSVINEIAAINSVLKDSYGTAVINQLHGTSAFVQKKYPQAVSYLREAADKMSELKIINDNSIDILLLLGKAEYATNNYTDAINHFRSATKMADQLNNLVGTSEGQLLISQSFQQSGMADSALYYFKSYALLKESLLSQQKQKNIIDIATRYETEKKEQAIRILETEKEANSYLLQLKNQQLEKQILDDEKKSQQLALLSQQNEINKLDAQQKTLGLDNEKKENEQRRANEELMGKEVAYQKLLLAKQNQEKKIIYIGIAVALIAGGYLLYRYVRKRSQQNQQEVLNERLRISRELHDEVGATLSGVALFSEIAKQKMEQQQTSDAQVYLNHISANSKEMVEKMSDIVWAINPDNDSFERIIGKLQTYAFNLCAGKGITLHLDFDDAMRSDYPAVQVKRNLYLFMKEAINNAIKYSAGKNIFLSLKKKDSSIVVEIKDDGKGFNTNIAYNGNGLKNMKARADNIDAQYSLESGQGTGTAVRIQFRFHPAGGHSAKA